MKEGNEWLKNRYRKTTKDRYDANEENRRKLKKVRKKKKNEGSKIYVQENKKKKQ